MNQTKREYLNRIEKRIVACRAEIEGCKEQIRYYRNVSDDPSMPEFMRSFAADKVLRIEDDINDLESNIATLERHKGNI